MHLFVPFNFFLEILISDGNHLDCCPSKSIQLTDMQKEFF